MTSKQLIKILLVDDEIQMRKLVMLTLPSEEFKVVEAVNGREGSSHAATYRPDLVLLDLGLPDISGLEVLKQIRDWSEVPVIILSVQDDSETIVEALNAGADDYLTKPFESKELIARIRVCLRRVMKKDPEYNVVEVRGLKIDLTNRLITRDGQEIRLTVTEYDLLKFLVKNANRVVTNRHILKEVWGPTSMENAQYPRVYVRHLRQKLEENPDDPKLITTEAGVGYRFRTKD